MYHALYESLHEVLLKKLTGIAQAHRHCCANEHVITNQRRQQMKLRKGPKELLERPSKIQYADKLRPKTLVQGILKANKAR